LGAVSQSGLNGLQEFYCYGGITENPDCSVGISAGSVSTGVLVETRPHGVAMWIILAFVIGAVVGVLIATLATVKAKVSRRSLQKKLERTEQTLEKERAQNDRTV
jgi:uncharacterized membrane protein YciS (DUF1049 family)